MIQYLLYGAQAAGLVTDVFAQHASYSVAKRGQKLEEQQLDLRLKQERLASQEQSIANLEQLSETLATQRALMSVRGGLPGIGSSGSVAQKSMSGFNKDEEARQLSLGFTEQNIKAKVAVSKLLLAGKKAQMGADLFGKAFNMVAFGEIGQSLQGTGKQGKYGKTIAPKYDFNSSLANYSKKSGLLTG